MDEDAQGSLGHLCPSSPPRSPASGKVTLHLPVVPHLQASVHTTIAQSLEEIIIIRAYMDVFVDELLEMPPDRAIKFKIQLQPGTTPISK
jgi:hypothetical protein